MEQVAAFNNENGFVSLVVPDPSMYDDGWLADSAKDHILSLAVPDEARHSVVWLPRSDVESLSLRSGGRTLRNAWVLSEGRVEVNLSLARTEKMAQLRLMRDAKLNDTDKEMARLSDIGTAQEVANLKAKRQALRDLPVNVNLEGIEDAATLADFIPEELL